MLKRRAIGYSTTMSWALYQHAGLPELGNVCCHDIDNLYVAGGSLFPTSGCSPPTLTIAALALRTAHHLAGTR